MADREKVILIVFIVILSSIVVLVFYTILSIKNSDKSSYTKEITKDCVKIKYNKMASIECNGVSA